MMQFSPRILHDSTPQDGGSIAGFTPTQRRELVVELLERARGGQINLMTDNSQFKLEIRPVAHGVLLTVWDRRLPFEMERGREFCMEFDGRLRDVDTLAASLAQKSVRDFLLMQVYDLPAEQQKIFCDLNIDRVLKTFLAPTGEGFAE